MSRLHQLFPLSLLFVMTACASTPQPEDTAKVAHQGHTHADGTKHAAHDHKDHVAGHHKKFEAPAKYAKSWNDPERDTWQRPDEIVKAMQLRGDGATVVDLGAGTGYLIPHLSKAVGGAGKVLALDVEAAMVTYLEQAKAKEAWSNVEVKQVGIDAPGLQEQSVDSIVILNTWHHISDRQAYANKLADSLKSGGTLLIVDFLKEKIDGGGPPMEMRLSAEEVVAELQAVGFDVSILEESMPRHYMIRGVVNAD